MNGLPHIKDNRQGSLSRTKPSAFVDIKPGLRLDLVRHPRRSLLSRASDRIRGEARRAIRLSRRFIRGFEGSSFAVQLDAFTCYRSTCSIHTVPSYQSFYIHTYNN